MVCSGADSNEDVHSILVDSSGRPYVVLSDGTNNLSTVKDELTGRTSILTSRGHGKNTITVEYAASTVATALITPGGGNHLDICGVYTSTASNAGILSLDFATAGLKVWRHYCTKYNSATLSDMHIEGVADEVLTVTTTQGAEDAFILVNYRELAP